MQTDDVSVDSFVSHPLCRVWLWEERKLFIPL